MRKIIFSIFLFFSFFLGSSVILAGWTPTNYTVASQNADNPEYTLPALAFNQSGYTVVAWTSFDTSFLPSRGTIQASISTDFGLTWSPAAYIDQADYHTPAPPGFGGANMHVRAAINENNQSLIVWHRYNSSLSRYEVRACSLTNTPLGPTTPSVTLLDPNAGVGESGKQAPRPKISMVGNSAIAIWDHENGGNHDVYYSITTDSGANWSTAQAIPMDGALTPNLEPVFAQLYFGATGLAVVIFQYSPDGTNNYTCQSVSTDSGNTWSNALILAGPSSGIWEWTFPALDGDNNGNAVAAWQIYTGTIYEIQSSSYISGSGWTPVQTIDPAAGYDWCEPRISVNNNNEAIITYQEDDSTGNYWPKIAFSSNSGQTWGVPVYIDPLNPENEWNVHPEIIIDDYGVVLCVWNSNIGGSNWAIKGAVSNDYGSTWSITTLSSLVTSNSAYCPRVKVYALDSGNKNALNGFAIWPHVYSGLPPYGAVETNHFQEITLKATGEQQKIKDFLQEELQNVISAEAIGNYGTFKLYKDAALTQLIGTVSNTHRVAKFIENNLVRGKSFTYYITWTDQFGKGTVGPVVVRIEG